MLQLRETEEASCWVFVQMNSQIVDDLQFYYILVSHFSCFRIYIKEKSATHFTLTLNGNIQKQNKMLEVGTSVIKILWNCILNCILNWKGSRAKSISSEHEIFLSFTYFAIINVSIISFLSPDLLSSVSLNIYKQWKWISADHIRLFAKVTWLFQLLFHMNEVTNGIYIADIYF